MLTAVPRVTSQMPEEVEVKRKLATKEVMLHWNVSKCLPPFMRSMRFFAKTVFSHKQKNQFQMELNQRLVSWVLEGLSLFPPEDTVSRQGQHTCWLAHTRSAQHRHSTQDGSAILTAGCEETCSSINSSSWSLVGTLMFGAGRLFPKDEFSFSECLRQAKAAPRQPSCPLVSSLPDGREICIPARD